MKSIKLFLLLVFCCPTFAQNVNPDLFQTWYLRYVISSDLDDPYQISQLLPTIIPTLDISEDLTFTGVGACNTFYGTFLLNPEEMWGDSYYSAPDFENTTEICANQTLIFFEETYFSFLEYGGWFNIYSNENGLELYISTPIFGSAIFQNYPLSSKEFYAEKIEIYPNPSSSQIFIKLNDVPVSNLEIINMFGQKVKNFQDNFESIDISDLPPGVYILNLNSEMGILSKRIVKK